MNFVMKHTSDSAASASINWKFIAILVGVLIVVAIAGVLMLVFSPKVHSLSENNVTIFSTQQPVESHLAQLADNSTFLVAVELQDGAGIANPYLANAASLFSVVLIGNQKDVTMVYRVLDEEQNLLYCRSNLGDVLKDEQLSASDCRDFESGFDGARVFIEWPDLAVNQNQVVLEENTLFVRTRDFDVLGRAAFFPLTKMFSNARGILDSVNDLAGQIR